MLPRSRYGPNGAIETPCLQGYEIAGKVWPSGDFSIGSRPEYKWVELEGEELQQQLDKEGERIGLLNASRSHIWDGDMMVRHPRRGENGITSHGRKVVKSAASLLEDRWGAENLSFLTVTLPPLHEDDAYAVVANWSDIVRGFFQRLRRLVQRKGGTWEYVAVTEIQPKRFNENAFMGLHIHAVCVGKYRSGWWITPQELRAAWKSAVERRCRYNYHWDACENIKRVSGGAGEYLGKYISKGTTEIEKIKEAHPLMFLPTSWYSTTKSLRKKVLCSCVSSASVLSALLALIVSANSSGVFCRIGEIYRESPDGPVFVGLHGRVTTRWLDNVGRFD